MKNQLSELMVKSSVYRSLKDSLTKGKGISNKDLKRLIPELFIGDKLKSNLKAFKDGTVVDLGSRTIYRIK